MQDLNVVLKRNVTLMIDLKTKRMFVPTTNWNPNSFNESVIVRTNKVEPSQVRLDQVELLDANIKAFNPPEYSRDLQYLTLTVGDVLKIHNLLKIANNYYVKLDYSDEGFYRLDMKVASRFHFWIQHNLDVDRYVKFTDALINRVFNALLLQSSDRKLIALFDDHWDLIVNNQGIYHMPWYFPLYDDDDAVTIKDLAQSPQAYFRQRAAQQAHAQKQATVKKPKGNVHYRLRDVQHNSAVDETHLNN